VIEELLDIVGGLLSDEADDIHMQTFGRENLITRSVCKWACLDAVM
jgi:hypothetical protein